MSGEEFENQLRQLIRKRPFEPFVVELLDGNQIDVDYPSVAFDGGAATFIAVGPDLIEFACEDVRAFHPPTHKATS
jgi:hypothetical protein